MIAAERNHFFNAVNGEATMISLSIDRLKPIHITQDAMGDADADIPSEATNRTAVNSDGDGRPTTPAAM